jgi:hypothetical protein
MVEQLSQTRRQVARGHEQMAEYYRYGGLCWFVHFLICSKREAQLLIHDTATLQMLEDYCSEFLIHAADVEGLCRGIDEDLVRCKLSTCLKNLDLLLIGM